MTGHSMAIKTDRIEPIFYCNYIMIQMIQFHSREPMTQGQSTKAMIQGLSSEPMTQGQSTKAMIQGQSTDPETQTTDHTTKELKIELRKSTIGKI